MARKSLRPHLNQIRTWTRQGRTDAWVAHQLEVTVQQIVSFKRESGLLDEEPGADGAATAYDDELDLRAADDARIAEELEAAEKERQEAEAAEAAERERLAALAPPEEEDAEAPKRRPRRGTRTRKARGDAPLEGTFDHGEEGYGLWLDPAVADDPIYAEHWAGHRPVTVTIEEDQIVIRRAE
jgi:hypothetical protein